MGDFSAEGGYLNRTLYQMCSDKPLHDDVEIVAAKIQLIGRAYSVTPGRGAGKRNENGKRAHFNRGLARHIVEYVRDLDQQIAEASNLGRISWHNLSRQTEIHDSFSSKVGAFACDCGIRANGRAIRNRSSFASKYLHFHAPMAFFIQDSIIEAAIRNEEFGRSRKKLPANCLKTGYASLCAKLLNYAEQVHSDYWTPRTIDGALYPYPVKDTSRIAAKDES